MTATATAPISERKKEYLTFYTFFDSVEELLYNNLRYGHFQMSIEDAAVCRAAYIHQKAGGLPIRDRRKIWQLDDEYVFPTDESFDNAINAAKLKGYLNENEEVRSDIEEFLNKIVDMAVSTNHYVTDEELFRHERMLADAELQAAAKKYEDDRRHTTGLS